MTLNDQVQAASMPRSGRAGAAVVVEDMGSRNGMLVDGRRLKDRQSLTSGCVLRIGTSSLTYVDGRIEDLAGRQLADCQLQHVVGRGSIGVVYRARRKADGQAVAIKLIDPGIAADAAQRARLINAMRAAARIDLDGVHPTWDNGVDGDCVYVVSPWAGNGSAANLASSGRPVPPIVATAIALDTARALEKAGTNGLGAWRPDARRYLIRQRWHRTRRRHWPGGK